MLLIAVSVSGEGYADMQHVTGKIINNERRGANRVSVLFLPMELQEVYVLKFHQTE